MAAAHVCFIDVVGCAALGQGEAGSRDAVRRVHDRNEAFSIPSEEAEQRRLPVVLEEAFAELLVIDDAALALAEGGCTGERGRLWREADEDLDEEVVVAKDLGHWVGQRHRTAQPTAVHTRGKGIGPGMKRNYINGHTYIHIRTAATIQRTYAHPSRIALAYTPSVPKFLS